MKSKFLLYFTILPFICLAQVGINTTLPQAQLDVRSSNQSNPMPTDGLLIPKIDVFPAVNPGTDQNGMMVFLTTTVGSNLPGFYYWNQPTLTWVPVKGDDGGTLNQAYNFGGPGAGRVINADVQDVEIIGEYGVSINKSNSGSNQALNISNISQVNNAATLRINSTFENNLGVGIINSVGGQTSLSLSHTAIQNRFDNISPSSEGAVTAILNTMNNSNNTPLSSGVVNRFSGPGNGTKIGFANVFERTGSGTNVGLNNQFVSPNQSISTGLRNTLNFNFGGTFYGVYNQLDGTNSSTSIKYGLFNEFPASASGLKYGVYSDVRGATDYSGYFLGRVAIGSSTANTYILPLSRGTNGQVIQTDGAGNASWTNATNFAWGLNGNAGTNPSTHFIGTTDNTDIVFRRSSTVIGRLRLNNINFGINSLQNLTTGIFNTALGFNALNAVTIGSNNIAIGPNSLSSNISGNGNVALSSNSLNNLEFGQGNIAIGTQSLQNVVNSNGKIAIGRFALLFHNSSNNNGRNIAIGEESQIRNQGSYNVSMGYGTISGSNTTALNTGEYNSAFGDSALFSNTSGTYNTALGASSMYHNTAGWSNTAIGLSSLHRNTNGGNNTVVGISALDRNTTGSRNTSIGSHSGRLDVTMGSNGNDNVYIGYQSGQNNFSGNNNTLIGSNANVADVNYNYAVAIGSGALVGRSNAIALGGSTLATRTRVGINVANPLFSLHINQIDNLGLGLDNGTNRWEFWNNDNLRMYYNGAERGSFNQTNGVYTSISDRRLKSNIQPLGSLLSKIKNLQPSNYTFTHDDLNRNQIGFIAQELNEIFPEFVYLNKSNETDRPEEELFTVDYSGMSVIALKAIQEQQEMIETLQQENQLLKNTLEQIKIRLESLEKK